MFISKLKARLGTGNSDERDKGGETQTGAQISHGISLNSAGQGPEQTA